MIPEKLPMRVQFDETRLWKGLFFSLLLGYCLAYAPYGTNETDGGFLSGLAWQLSSGKALYRDVLYVRPPLPVWLRTAEMAIFPENWSVLCERWLFFGKVALYSWLAAATLAAGRQSWILAVFGFVVSVHCFTPMAWHTVDGILFGSLGFWALFRVGGRVGHLLAGAAIAAAMLCKQSFYPLPIVFAGLMVLQRKKNAWVWGAAGLTAILALIFSYLYQTDALEGFFQMTRGAASGRQAVQHGVLDYVRINPWVAAASAVLLPLPLWCLWRQPTARLHRLGLISWTFWLVLLAQFYLRAIGLRQDFTAPFAQARVLFDLALAYGVWRVWAGQWGKGEALPFFALLSLSWCAGVSWGYNLPILMATPMVFAAMDISTRLWSANYPGRNAGWRSVVALAALLAVFRYGYEFVYRDGRRSDMTVEMGRIFPAMNGIRSDTASAALYLDLHDLAERYGPMFKTLPSFSQANFLTRTYPPLPLDWVVGRESNRDNTLIIEQMNRNRPIFFIEKSYDKTRIAADTELTFTQKVLSEGKLLDETPHFWVVQFPAR